MATTEATGTRCAEKVDFGKRVKQEKIEREHSPQKGNGWSGREGLHLLYKICWKTKIGPPTILAPHPQIQPKFGLAKIAKLTAKIIHVNYQMQQDSHAPHAYVQIKTGYIMPDSSGAVKENWGEKSVSDENEHTPK